MYIYIYIDITDTMTIYIFSNIIYKAESQCERKLFTMPIMWSGV